MVATVRLRKNQDRRLRAGHPWVFSNEIEGNIGEVRNVILSGVCKVVQICCVDGADDFECTGIDLINCIR